MNRESLSALFDGECSGAELGRLLDSLDREPALKAEWSRLCLARETLKSPLSAAHDAGFSSRVMAAIAAESAAPRANVIPFPFPTRAWRLTQPLVGYAMAASLGAFVVFGLMTPRDDGGGDLAEAPVQVASYAAEKPTPVAGHEQDAQLDGYLIDYSHYRARQGMGGSLGYARVAAHNAVYRREASDK